MSCLKQAPSHFEDSCIEMTRKHCVCGMSLRSSPSNKSATQVAKKKKWVRITGSIDSYATYTCPYILVLLIVSAHLQLWIRSAIPSLGKDKKWRTLGGAGSIILTMAERSGANKIATKKIQFTTHKRTRTNNL